MNSGHGMKNAPQTVYVYIDISPSSVHWEGLEEGHKNYSEYSDIVF